MRCETPARGGGGEEIVLVALNGQQFEGGGGGGAHAASFFFYTPPTAQAIWPRSGPRAGGTRIALSAAGVALHGAGAALECKFGETTGGGGATAGDEAFMCTAPAFAVDDGDEANFETNNGSWAQPLSVQLNGQQMHQLAAFAVFEPPVTQSVAPPTAFTTGGQRVAVRGAWLTPGAATEHWCAFGPAPTGCTQTGCARGLRVPATIVGWDHLACVAPSADAAGARVEVAVDFGDAAAVGARATMWGDAALLDGALRLSAIGPESHGALVLRAAAALPPLAEFEVRFDVVLRSEAPPTNEEAIWASFLNPIDQIPVDWDTVDLDDGRVVDGRAVAIHYGAFDDGAPLDDLGASHGGLVASLRSGRTGTLEIRCGGRLLHSQPIDGAMRRGAWAPLSVRVGASPGCAETRCVRVAYAGSVLADNVPLGSGVPTPDAGWRVAVATGPHNDGDAKDELWVHDVRLLSGGLAPSLAVPVRVSLNGQQFEPADAASAATLTMLAPPLLSAVAPPVGPRDGGTRVVVSGANLHGGSAPRCRFGALAPVVATEDAGGGLRCEAPPSAAAGDGTVAVSLNGAQFAPATAAFAYLGATAVDALAPAHGPAAGGTNLALRTRAAHGGSFYLCRFFRRGRRRDRRQRDGRRDARRPDRRQLHDAARRRRRPRAQPLAQRPAVCGRARIRVRRRAQRDGR